MAKVYDAIVTLQVERGRHGDHTLGQKWTVVYRGVKSLSEAERRARSMYEHRGRNAGPNSSRVLHAQWKD